MYVGMEADAEADLAQAIANSLADQQQPRQLQPPQQHTQNQSASDLLCTGLSQEELELAAQVEDSYRHAKRHRQESTDAQLASDLATIESARQSERDEERRITEQDAELASDLAAVDSIAQSDLNECQQLALQEVSHSFVERNGREHRQGAWDCPSCTFHNRPYSPRCEACFEPAPRTVLTFRDIPATRFGVELEIIIPNGIRDGMSCQWVAEQLSALGVPTRYAGYTHEISNEWKVVTDASLRSSSSDDLCFELVSPVLHGDDGLDSVRLLLESVRRIGIEINSTCGFHVHVDATTGPLSELPGLKRLAQCFVALESAFDCLVARDASLHATNRRANRHRYCRSNVLALGALSNRQRWHRIEDASSLSDLVSIVNPNNDRYRKLNLTNLTREDRPSTCEFRQHGGVSELLVAESWIRLVLSFCHVSANDPSSSGRCLLRQEATLAEELQALLRLVDCPGLESFYVLERRLFSIIQSESKDRRREWKCRCGRTFKDSRSLTQHANDTNHQTM
mmetsp:Transcript_11133/g.23468  ORF Transcript_11133/g.23468 Transcript_11133/m.23468 type:complete len:512 (-) Transcript_11133:182-1717(-)